MPIKISVPDFMNKTEDEFRRILTDSLNEIARRSSTDSSIETYPFVTSELVSQLPFTHPLSALDVSIIPKTDDLINLGDNNKRFSFAWFKQVRIGQYSGLDEVSGELRLFDEKHSATLSELLASGPGVTDHGLLTGLSDDDHDQYLLADGKRFLRGSLLPSPTDTINLGAVDQIYHSVFSNFLYTTRLTAGSIPFIDSDKSLNEDNARLFWDKTNYRLGIGNNSPSYTLDVTGQARITTNLGVGTTPNSSRAINALLTGTWVGDLVGGYAIGQNDYAAGAQTGTVYGWLSEAKQNQATILANAIGYQGGVTISIDDGTITTAFAVRARINLPAAAAGHPRTITTAYMYGMSQAFGANDVIGTLYGFHMPSVSATVKWGVYIADTAANSYFAAQTQHANGSAGAPGIAWIGRLTDGLFSVASSAQAVTLAGVERFRWSANDVGMVATGRLYLDGVGCTAAGGTYIRERAANIICLTADANDQYEVRADHMYGRPTGYAPAADGEHGFNTTYNALEHRSGGAVHYNGCLLYSGPLTAESVSWSGVKAETAFATTFTIPAAYLVPGKTLHILAYVYSDATGSIATFTLRLRLGGLTGILLASALAGGSGGTSTHYTNNLLESIVLVNTRAVGGLVTPFGINRHYDADSPVDETIYTLTSTQFRYADATGSALNTTVTQDVVLTYESGTVGAYNATLKFLMVWAN